MEELIQLLRSCTNFKAVYTLEEYFSLISAKVQLLDYPISPTFTAFLRSTMIALDVDYVFPEEFSASVKYNYCNLVDNTISSLLCKKNTENSLRLDEPVQTLGYCYYKASGNLRKNPMITLMLKSPDWENLHRYVGSDLMIHLIEGKGISVFMRYQEAFVQVIGANIAKFLKCKPAKIKRPEVPKKFKELKLFKTNQKREDVLNKLPHINKVKMLYNPLIRRKFKLAHRNLLNLSPKDAGPQIAHKILGPKSREKYLIPLSQYFSKLAYNYQRLNLGSHINKHCPLPSDFKPTFNENSSSSYPFEWLFSSNTPIAQVGNYLITALKKILPLDLIGGKKNLKALNKSVSVFIKLGVWEKISCAAICSRFKMSGFKWIKETADIARRLLVGKIVSYLFNDFIIPILQISFYITEKQHDTSVLFFYRKPVWAVISSLVKAKLEGSEFFKRLDVEEKQRWEDFTKFPPAKLRVQPKMKDFRPIMHFKSKIVVNGSMRLSGNNLIAGVPQILRSSLLDPEKTMCLDYPTLIAKLEEFSKSWHLRGKPDLHFLTMDIAKAFDSVKIDRLVAMVDELEVPVISAYYKYIQLLPRFAHRSQGAMQALFKMKYKKQAVDEGSCPFFHDLLLRPQSINILTARTTFITGDKLKMVNRVLQGNIVKYNRQFFKTQQGIPQGLPCSPLLSNLYYSQIEERVIAEAKKKHENELLLVIRLHDDYLILAEKPETVLDVFNAMENAAIDNGFHFASSKINSNLAGPWIHKEEIDGWVGLDIDKNLQVIPHVNEAAKRQISFDFISSSISLVELKSKLIKMTNLTVNLLKFRSAANIEALQKALSRLMALQASRFLFLLKVTRKVYGVKHSLRAISQTIVSVLKFSQRLISIEDFFKISLKAFSEVFKSSEYHGISCRLKAYLVKLV